MSASLLLSLPADRLLISNDRVVVLLGQFVGAFPTTAVILACAVVARTISIHLIEHGPAIRAVDHQFTE